MYYESVYFYMILIGSFSRDIIQPFTWQHKLKLDIDLFKLDPK